MASSKVTESTIESYRRRVDQIRRQVAEQQGYESPLLVPATDLVSHLIGRKQAAGELLAAKKRGSGVDRERIRALERDAISRATWRQYKAALVHVFKEERSRTVDGVLAQELDHAIGRLQAEAQTGALKTSMRSSGAKEKGFTDADFEAIISYLTSKIGKHQRANQLLTWLKASRLVGVRPSEWQSAGLTDLDGRPAVRFGNAKATNGRGNGEFRTLHIISSDPADVQVIDDMLYMLVELEKDAGYEFAANLDLLARYMRYVTRKVLGPRDRYPTLYSLRHQFAADGKAALGADGDQSEGDAATGKAKLAAMLGHGSDATAGKHYGKKAKGQRALKVAPADVEVASVRHRAKPLPPQLKAKAKA